MKLARVNSTLGMLAGGPDQTATGVGVELELLPVPVGTAGMTDCRGSITGNAWLESELLFPKPEPEGVDCVVLTGNVGLVGCIGAVDPNWFVVGLIGPGTTGATGGGEGLIGLVGRAGAARVVPLPVCAPYDGDAGVGADGPKFVAGCVDGKPGLIGGCTVWVDPND